MTHDRRVLVLTALQVVGEGAVFLFGLAVMFVAIWLVAP